MLKKQKNDEYTEMLRKILELLHENSVNTSSLIYNTEQCINIFKKIIEDNSHDS